MEDEGAEAFVPCVFARACPGAERRFCLLFLFCVSRQRASLRRKKDDI